MSKIVVSDIFGITPALEKLCRALGGDVDIVDPYAGKCMGFQTEEQAYDFFTANMSVNAYGSLLQAKLKNTRSALMLIGFSVGASAVWQISGSLSPEKVKRAVCFYGSQIRHLTEINPGVVVEHILPGHEPGFNVDELVNRLSVKKNVVLHRTPYLHGFMNPLSKNYDGSGYVEYIDWLRRSAG